MRTRGEGVKKSKNSAGFINGCSPSGLVVQLRLKPLMLHITLVLAAEFLAHVAALSVFVLQEIPQSLAAGRGRGMPPAAPSLYGAVH